VFVAESEITVVDGSLSMHSYHTPLFLTAGYLVSLPTLNFMVRRYFSDAYIKDLMKESMVLYNISQVVLNGWMVWRFVDAVVNRNHPFIGDISTANCGTLFPVWVHYTDKYLEFFDTYFMVLRGRMDQVSFLHVYHHVSIVWAWWLALILFPAGDAYFGALLNSGIHVLMYSYYLLALLKIPCPWKKYLTQAQLLQFTSVLVYSSFCIMLAPKEIEARHYAAIFIQIWEMASLFVLFSIFYKKSYRKSKKPANSAEDDQCQAAVKAAVQGAAKAVESAAKDAGKARKVTTPMHNQATKVVKRQNVW